MTIIVSESYPISFLLAAVAMLGALVLAWRAYRHAVREDCQRKLAVKRRLRR